MTRIDLIQEVAREMAIARMRVLTANRRKFDIEAEDHLDAMREADVMELSNLATHWKTRAEFWKMAPAGHLPPPMLLRCEDEPIEQYLERCYQSERG